MLPLGWGISVRWYECSSFYYGSVMIDWAGEPRNGVRLLWGMGSCWSFPGTMCRVGLRSGMSGT